MADNCGVEIVQERRGNKVRVWDKVWMEPNNWREISKKKGSFLLRGKLDGLILLLLMYYLLLLMYKIMNFFSMSKVNYNVSFVKIYTKIY